MALYPEPDRVKIKLRTQNARPDSTRILSLLFLLVWGLILSDSLIPRPVHWDSFLYLEALDRFDVTASQPQPPGYIFYVVAARIITLFTKNAFFSYLLLNVAAIVSLFFLSMKLSRYFSSSPLPLIIIPLSSPLLIYYSGQVRPFIPCAGIFCWLVYSFLLSFRARKINIFQGLLFGIAGGFRPQVMTLLLPVFILTTMRARVKHPYRIRVIVFWVIGCLLWFIPLCLTSGGLTEYLHSLYELWTKNTTRIPVYINWGMMFIGFVLLMPAGWIVLFLRLYSLKRQKKFPRFSLPANDLLFWTTALVPALLFYLFVYLQDAGFCSWLLVLSGFLVASALSRLLPREKLIFVSLLVFALNILYFLFIPSHYSSKGVRALAGKQDSIVQKVRSTYSSDDTLIVTTDSFYFGLINFLHLLPEYRTVHWREIINNLHPSFYRKTRGYEFFTTMSWEKVRYSLNEQEFKLYLPEGTRNVIFMGNFLFKGSVYGDGPQIEVFPVDL